MLWLAAVALLQVGSYCAIDGSDRHIIVDLCTA